MPKKANKNRLTKAQQKKFYKIRNSKGADAAKQYRTRTIRGGQGAALPNIVEGDIAAGQAAAQANVPVLNPNVTTPFGSSTTTVNDDGTVDVVHAMDPTQAGLLQGSQGLNAAGTAAANAAVGGYTPFTDPTRPPASGGQLAIGTGSKGGLSHYGIGGNGGQPGGQPDPFRFQMGDYSDERARVEQDVYGRLTKNVDRDESRRVDAKKQELYNKGIPYSDDPNSRYQKEMGGIREEFGGIRSDAQARATEMGASELRNAYDITSGAFDTNLGGIGQEFKQDILTHQQGINDASSLSNLGTGAILPDMPGYNAPPPITPVMPSSWRQAMIEKGYREDQLAQLWEIAQLQANTSKEVAGISAGAAKDVANINAASRNESDEDQSSIP